MKLRNYQLIAKNKIYSAFRNGVQNVMLQLPTGAGKTVLFSSIIEDGYKLGRRILVLAHREELIMQAYTKLYKGYGIKAGIIKAGHTADPANPVQIASVQTLRNRTLLHPVDIVIIDECFPSNTLVDNMPISELKIGDYVTAFDENNSKFVRSKILRVFKKPSPNILYKITIANNVSIICTEEHPIFTKEGWVPAKLLKLNQFIGYYNGNESNMHDLQQSHCKYQRTSEIFLQKNKSNILLARMCKAKCFNNNVKDKQKICFRKNDNKQPYEKGRSKKKSKPDTNCYGMETANKRRQWVFNKSTINVGKCSKLGNGSTCKNIGKTREQSTKIANKLQTRYSKQRVNGRNRSRREFTFSISEKSPRHQKTKLFEFIRVDNIEIYEQRNTEQFRKLCPDGHVYNIEVEKYHTYTANGLIVHNCHHSQAKNSYGKIRDYVLSMNPNTKFLGVTATPCRTNGSGFKDVYDELIQGISIDELIKQGHLSPPKYYVAPLKLDNVKISAGDYNLKELSTEYQSKVHEKDLVSNWLKLAKGMKTIGFAVDIEHSKTIVAEFNRQGIKAAHIDGTTPKESREYTIEQFKNGHIIVLYNVGVFDEGFDLPEIEAVQLARPTKSLIKFMQMVGRGLRPADGKKQAIILDHGGLVAEHDIVERERVWTLEGVKQKDKEIQTYFKDIETNKYYLPDKIPFDIPMDRIELVELRRPADYLEKAKIQKINSAYNKLRYIADTKKFSPKWVWYKLIANIKPSPDRKKTEEEIKMYADFYTGKMNYKPGHAHFLTQEYLKNIYQEA